MLPNQNLLLLLVPFCVSTFDHACLVCPGLPSLDAEWVRALTSHGTVMFNGKTPRLQYKDRVRAHTQVSLTKACSAQKHQYAITRFSKCSPDHAVSRLMD